MKSTLCIALFCVINVVVMAFPSDIVKSVKEELAKRHVAQSFDALTRRNLAEGVEILTTKHETRGVDPNACMRCMNNAATMNQSDIRQVCGVMVCIVDKCHRSIVDMIEASTDELRKGDVARAAGQCRDMGFGK